MTRNYRRTRSPAAKARAINVCMAASRKLVPLILAAAAVLMLRIPLAHADSTPAEAFVQQSVNKGFGILKDTSLPKQERQAQFRAWLRSIIDFKRVAVFSLGSYAKNASDKQVDEFVNAFSDYLMSLFHLDGDNVGSIPLAVTGSQTRSADDVIVNAKIVGAAAPAGTPMTISFRVRKDAAGNDVIVDILVGGVSVAVTQRDEFATYLQQHGGNVAELSAELEKRVATG